MMALDTKIVSHRLRHAAFIILIPIALFWGAAERPGRALNHALRSSSNNGLQALRAANLSEITQANPELAGWIDSLVWGNGKATSSALRRTFKVAGVFHLLSVSGSHVAALVAAASALLLLPWYLIHLFALLPGHHWTFARRWAPLCLVPILLGYIVIVGASQAALRSGLLGLAHVMTQVGSDSSGRSGLSDRLLRTASIQAALLPGDFLSGANLMSWVGYITILDVQSRSFGNPRWYSTAWAVVLMQIELGLWGSICFGQASLIGVLANAVLVPLFAPVFWLAIGLAIWPSFFLKIGADTVQYFFISIVETAAAAADRWPWLYWERIIWTRVELVMALGIGCALTWKRLARLLSSAETKQPGIATSALLGSA